MLLNKLTSQQLSIVWHAKLSLSIINFSKRVFVSVIQKLVDEKGGPSDVESLVGLIHLRSEGKVLNKFIFDCLFPDFTRLVLALQFLT